MAGPLDWLLQALGGGPAGAQPSATGDALSALQREIDPWTGAPQGAAPTARGGETQDPLANTSGLGDLSRLTGLPPWYQQSPMDIAMGFAPNAMGGAIRAYHGSPHNFDRFDPTKIGETTDPGMMGRALYFSTDPAVAKAGPHRYEVDLNVKSPLLLDHPLDQRSMTKSDLAGEALGIPPPTPGMLALGAKSPNLPAWQQWAESVSEAARKRGHDAAVLDYSPMGYKHQEIAVYDPTIIALLRKFGILPPIAAGGALGALLDGEPPT